MKSELPLFLPKMTRICVYEGHAITIAYLLRNLRSVKSEK